jgi:dihydrofolate reductase
MDGVIEVPVPGVDTHLPYGDWSGPYRTPAGRDALFARHGADFDLLLGRRTYDLWSTSWGKAPSSPYADAINAAKKYVLTHRPESLAWGPAESVGPDPIAAIRRLKSQPGRKLIVWGSSAITSAILEHGLADEMILLVYPLFLGKGKRLFAEGTPPRAFDLLNTSTSPTGIIINTYKPIGALRTEPVQPAK